MRNETQLLGYKQVQKKIIYYQRWYDLILLGFAVALPNLLSIFNISCGINLETSTDIIFVIIHIARE
ncbi:MAG: hypothetical protein F6K22_30510 [Okeania sp. SIO2F4]|nr:hypothetical protein [Okeania sp. SIO2F4]